VTQSQNRVADLLRLVSIGAFVSVMRPSMRLGRFRRIRKIMCHIVNPLLMDWFLDPCTGRCGMSLQSGVANPKRGKP
jgi:hypothetical protein